MALPCSTASSHWHDAWHGTRSVYSAHQRSAPDRKQGPVASRCTSLYKGRYDTPQQWRRTCNASTMEPGSLDEAEDSASLLYSFVTTCLDAFLRRANETDASLEGILGFPYDVLLEIFGHLSPLDLLNVSRTSHQFRNILLNRAARGVWRASFGNVLRLPPCPSDLNEVQYAALAFDDWCSFCLAPVVDQISWLCRERPCPKCIKEQFVPQTELAEWISKDLCLESPESIFPYLRRRGQRHYLRSSLKAYIHELDCLPGENIEKSLSHWQERRKAVQAEKQTHAVNSDTWLIQWKAAQQSLSATSYLTELGLVIVLLLTLLYLWSEQLFPELS